MPRNTTESPRKDLKPPDFVQRGKVLILRRQFQEAVKACRLGLLAHPTYVEGRLVLAMALMALNRHDEVLAEVRVALELDPDNPLAHLLKGEALFHRSDLAQAKEVLVRAHELDPLNVKVRTLLEEIDAAGDLAPAPGLHATTDTRVYPAQRAQALGVRGDPTDALAEVVWAGEEADRASETHGPRGTAAARKIPDGSSTCDEEPEEDEYTTAPFLAPVHLTGRAHAPVDQDIEEQTIAEEPPMHGVGDTEAGTGGTGTADALAPLSGEPTAPHAWRGDGATGPGVRDADASRGDSPGARERGATEEVLIPEAATDVERIEMGTPGEEPSRSLRSDAPPERGEDWDDGETAVNADAPSPEALFGEEHDDGTPREGSQGGRPARMAAEPTRNVGLPKKVSLPGEPQHLPEPAERTPSPPHASQVRCISGVEVETTAHQRGSVSGDADLETAFYTGTSEISVVPLPEEVPMPPLPEDALASGRRAAPASPAENAGPPPGAPLPRHHETAELSAEDDASVSGDEDLRTRVKFEEPPEPAALRSTGRPGLAPDPDPDSFENEPVWSPGPYEASSERARVVDSIAFRAASREPFAEGAPESRFASRHPISDVPTVPPMEDEDELELEPADADVSGPMLRQGHGGRTLALTGDEGRAYPYLKGPQPSQAAPRPTEPGFRRRARHPVDDDGAPPPWQNSGAPRQRGRPATSRPARERTATTFLSLLMGGLGSRRWLFLLAGAVAVLLAAVGVGLAVRYVRLGDQVEAKRRQAATRLHAGNLQDFMSAAQSYADILLLRPNDDRARWALARIQAAILFEFGNPSGQTTQAEGPRQAADPDRLAAEIYTKLNAGFLSGAAAAAVQATKLQPKSAVLHYLAGRVSLLLGNAGEAQRRLHAASKLDPGDTMILRALAESLADQGKSEVALERCQRALAQNPDHVASLLEKAKILMLRRSSEQEAELELRSIVIGHRKHLASRGQRGWACLILARLALQRGQAEQARSYLTQAKSNAPVRDAPFLDETAALLIQSFQLGEAEKVVQQSKETMKGRPQPAYYMARIHLLHGLPTAALADLSQAGGLGFAAASLLRAQIHLELGELTKAEQEIDATLKIAADLLEAHVVKAKIRSAKGQHDIAEKLLLSLLEKHPRNAMLLTAHGEVHLAAKRNRQARQRFEEALREDPRAFEAQLKLAQLAETEGRFNEALKALAEASRSNYGNMVALKELARLQSDVGDLNEATTNYQEVLRRTPNDAMMRLSLARVLTLRRSFVEAEKEIRLAQTRADAGALALARGRLDLHRGTYGQASIHLVSATTKQRHHVEAWGLLVRAYLEDYKEPNARETAREMARLFPNAPEPEVAKARVEFHLGHWPAAVGHLRRALSLTSQMPRPPAVEAEWRVLLGRTHQEARRFALAEEEYGRAAQVCRLCAEPLYRRAMAQQEQGATGEASRNLESAVALEPNRAEILYELAQIYDQGGKRDKALAAYRRYLDLNPAPELRKAVEEAIRNLGQR